MRKVDQTRCHNSQSNSETILGVIANGAGSQGNLESRPNGYRFADVGGTLKRATVALTEFLNQARLSEVAYASAPLEWHWAWSAFNQPDVERWSSGEALDLAGIGSMSFALGLYCVTFGCWVRWVEFVTNDSIDGNPVR